MARTEHDLTHTVKTFLRRTVAEYKRNFPGVTDIHLYVPLTAKEFNDVDVQRVTDTLLKFPGTKRGSNDAYNRDVVYVNIATLERNDYRPRSRLYNAQIPLRR